jgi:hypothetical protein
MCKARSAGPGRPAFPALRYQDRHIGVARASAVPAAHRSRAHPEPMVLLRSRVGPGSDDEQAQSTLSTKRWIDVTDAGSY